VYQVGINKGIILPYLCWY